MLKQLNSPVMYLICGCIILFVAIMCVVFLVRAYRAGKAIGMDPKILKRTITSSATFSILPSVGIFLGVIALSGSLGTPWPWLRLSVIGALHYETQVAEAAAEQVGLGKLTIQGMTPTAFSTIALLMSICIMWGMILSFFFNKSYINRLEHPKAGKKKKGKSGSSGFGDMAMKDVSAELEVHLNTEKTFTSCDLYELVLANGNTYRYADCDCDIVLDNRIYRHDALIIKRQQISLQGQVTVDTLAVTIYADGNHAEDTIESMPIMAAAHSARGKHPADAQRAYPWRAVSSGYISGKYSSFLQYGAF